MSGTQRSRRQPVDVADTLADLREEINGLRAAARLRSVIEQAKGVLVERHQIPLDEAFGRLRAMSQEHNVRLVEVAATVVGVTVPDTAPEIADDVLRSMLPPSPQASDSWTALQREPDVRAGVASALADTVASAARHGDDAAELLSELLAAESVDAVTIFRRAPDEALRLVGQCGVPGDGISSWRSIPPSTDLAFVVSVTENRAIFSSDPAARDLQFPLIGAGLAASPFVAAAGVPVVDGDRVVGVVGLLWTDEQEFTEERSASITRSVQRISHLLLRGTQPVDPDAEWLSCLLRLHLDPWVLLEVVADDDGGVRDFVVQDVAGNAPGSDEWAGRRLLELWPVLAEDATTDALSGLMKAGGFWTMTVATASAAPWGTPGSAVRAVRLGRRIVVVWRPGRRTSTGVPGGVHSQAPDRAETGDGA